MSDPVIRYPLDATGVNPDNYVSNEPHTLAQRRIRAIAPVYGPFFNDSVRLVETQSSRVLVYGTHYTFAELQKTPTALYGKGISGVILVIDQTVLPQVSLSYQVLGGEYAYSSNALVSLLNDRLDDSPLIDWTDIIGKPDEFPPGQHLHDIGDTYGWEMVVAALERIRNAILWSDTPTYDALLKLIRDTLAECDVRFGHLLEQNLEAAIISLRAQFTKVTIGLGSVENLALGSYNDGAWAANTVYRIDDIYVNKYIGLDALMGFRDKLLSYVVRSDTTGLGLEAPNVGGLSRSMMAGMVNGASVLVYSQNESSDRHIAFEANAFPPGSLPSQRFNVTKITNNAADRGGLFMFTSEDGVTMHLAKMQTSLTWPTWNRVTLDVEMGVIVEDITDLIANHVKDYNNPHRVTAEQVGLGFVQNLPVATHLDIDLKRAVDKYVTLAQLIHFNNKWGGGGGTGGTGGQATYTASILFRDRAGLGVGYIFSASDTRDPRATKVVKDSIGTTMGYAYEETNESATVAMKNGTNVIGYMLPTPTATAVDTNPGGGTTNINAFCAISLAPPSVPVGTQTVATFTVNGLTAGNSYTLVVKLTNPSNVTTNYNQGGVAYTATIVASSSGSATHVLAHQTTDQTVGVWKFGADITAVSETVNVTASGGTFTITAA